jgi:D-alanyl-D-alanine carboxypeptidase/D-alanyl-D-alanine-endopeptidase (penicillin-binding protein 4)
MALLSGSEPGAQSVRTAPPAAAQQPLRQLATDLRTLTASEGVRRGLWGIIVYSLDRRQRLFELNPQALLVPASTTKLISVASAYEAVGWNYRFATTVWATGPIVDGTLKGDLVVSGSGDPSIASRGFAPLEEWVTALKDLGIQTIDGRIIGDDDAIEEPRPSLAWTWDDLGYPTGAIFGALNAEENRMVVRVSPGETDGSPAPLSVEPRALHRPLISRVTTTAGAVTQLWPEQRPAEAALTIAGSMRLGAKPASLSVSVGNPTRWFAGLLRHHLVEGGVHVTGEAVDVDDVPQRPQPDDEGAQTLFVHRSPTLGEMVAPLLKSSINLYGEAFLRLNSRPGVLPTNDAALDGLRTRLAAWGVPADAAQIIDGSGLSRRDALAPDVLLAALQRMYDPSGRSPFMQGLPVAGVDGSLSGRMKNSAGAGNVRAKTGTMSNIRTLAGYVTTVDGEQMALVAMINNFEGTGAQAGEAIDAIATLVATFSRTAPPGGCCTVR